MQNLIKEIVEFSKKLNPLFWLPLIIRFVFRLDSILEHRSEYTIRISPLFRWVIKS